jgi:hypothetical protein
VFALNEATNVSSNGMPLGELQPWQFAQYSLSGRMTAYSVQTSSKSVVTPRCALKEPSDICYTQNEWVYLPPRTLQSTYTYAVTAPFRGAEQLRRQIEEDDQMHDTELMRGKTGKAKGKSSNVKYTAPKAVFSPLVPKANVVPKGSVTGGTGKGATPPEIKTLHRVYGFRHFDTTFNGNLQQPRYWEYDVVDVATNGELYTLNTLYIGSAVSSDWIFTL